MSVALKLVSKHVLLVLLLCGRHQHRCCHSHTCSYPLNVLSLYTLCRSVAGGQPEYFARIFITDATVYTFSHIQYVYSLLAYSVSWASARS